MVGQCFHYTTDLHIMRSYKYEQNNNLCEPDRRHQWEWLKKQSTRGIAPPLFINHSSRQSTSVDQLPQP